MITSSCLYQPEDDSIELKERYFETGGSRKKRGFHGAGSISSSGARRVLIVTAYSLISTGKEIINVLESHASLINNDCGGTNPLVVEDYMALRVFDAPANGWEDRVQDKWHLEEIKQFTTYIRGKAPAPISLEDMLDTFWLSIQIAGCATPNQPVDGCYLRSPHVSV